MRVILSGFRGMGACATEAPGTSAIRRTTPIHRAAPTACRTFVVRRTGMTSHLPGWVPSPMKIGRASSASSPITWTLSTGDCHIRIAKRRVCGRSSMNVSRRGVGRIRRRRDLQPGCGVGTGRTDGTRVARLGALSRRHASRGTRRDGRAKDGHAPHFRSLRISLCRLRRRSIRAACRPPTGRWLRSAASRWRPTRAFPRRRCERAPGSRGRLQVRSHRWPR